MGKFFRTNLAPIKLIFTVLLKWTARDANGPLFINNFHFNNVVDLSSECEYSNPAKNSTTWNLTLIQLIDLDSLYDTLNNLYKFFREKSVLEDITKEL